MLLDHTRNRLAGRVVWVLICGLTLAGSGEVSAQVTTSLPTPEIVRERVISWGVGKNIAVRTLTGAKLRGKIQSIGLDRFEIRHGRNEIDGVRYDEVTRIGTARTTVRMVVYLGIAAYVLGVVMPAILTWESGS